MKIEVVRGGSGVINAWAGGRGVRKTIAIALEGKPLGDRWDLVAAWALAYGPALERGETPPRPPKGCRSARIDRTLGGGQIVWEGDLAPAPGDAAYWAVETREEER